MTKVILAVILRIQTGAICALRGCYLIDAPLLILGPRSLCLTSIQFRAIPLTEQSGFQSIKPSQGKVFYTLTSVLSNLDLLERGEKGERRRNWEKRVGEISCWRCDLR